MKPDRTEVEDLIRDLTSRNSPKFNDLREQGRKFAHYLERLDGFKLVDSDRLLQIQHVGRVIVDAVLQVGHDYEKQVRKRVERLTENCPEAATVSGFIRLLSEQGISRLLDWDSQGTEKDLLAVADFFINQGIETYSELREWLKSEEHRDSLLSTQSGLGGNSTFRVADKTADYFRLLVHHWDSVAVDKGIGLLLAGAGIVSLHSKKYSYKEKRSIVQLAALKLDCRPIDLDNSIYFYYVNNKSNAGSTRRPIRKSEKDFKYCLGCGEKIPRHANYCTECGARQV